MKRARNLWVAPLGAAVLTLTLIPALSAGADPWTAQLGELERQVQDGRWETVRQQALELAEQIAHASGSKGENRKPLAQAAAYAAIAEAALGQHHEARWHWYLAQNLDAGARDYDLADLGSAGAFLRRHLLLPLDQQVPLTDVYDPEDGPRGFQRPERVKVVYPRRPRALSEQDRFSHVVFVQVTIDERGELSQPLVMDAAFYPGLVYSAFEALRDWSYRPATVEGRPIPFRFVMPVVFRDDRPEQSAVFF